jgi:hypothetical protein
MMKWTDFDYDDSRAGSPTFRKLLLDIYPPEGNYVVPTSFELQLDIDSEEGLKFFKKMIFRFRKEWDDLGLLKILSINVEPSSTVGHYHVYITLSHYLSITERILWQCFLGSDLVREMRSYCRFRWSMKDPILLIPKGKGHAKSTDRR